MSGVSRVNCRVAGGWSRRSLLALCALFAQLSTLNARLSAGVALLQVRGTQGVVQSACPPSLSGPPRCRPVEVQQSVCCGATAVNIGRTSEGWILLTAAHTFRRLNGVSSVQAQIRGEWVSAAVLYVGDPATEDLAVLRLQSGLDLRFTALAADDPPTGATVETAGFPMGGPLVGRAGLVAGAGRATMDSAVVSGESGGSVVSGGQLVGLISGSSDDAGRGQGRHLYFVPVSVIRARLAALPLGTASPPAGEVASRAPPAAGCQCESRFAALTRRLESLEAQVNAIQPAAGPVGPPGPPGPAGPPGVAPDLTALTREVQSARESLAQLRALDRDTVIRVWNADGTVAGESRTNLFRGEAIDLRFNPRVARGTVRE